MKSKGKTGVDNIITVNVCAILPWYDKERQLDFVVNSLVQQYQVH